MKDLRTIRIFLATLFFIGAVAYLAISETIHPMARIVPEVQIVPSLLASGLGAIVVWFGITFLFGRVYCSAVCPVGILQDLIIFLRRYIRPLRRPYSYRKPVQFRYHLLVIYLFCLVAGVTLVSFAIEPWHIMQNICGAFHPSRMAAVWLTRGGGVPVGIIAGIVSLLLLVVFSLLTGRGFCTMVCPIGTALGCFGDNTLYHIEIDPDKCVNCMKCEEICRSQCIKVVGRHVDNSRCVRCFDCVKVCPNDAIRFQVNRNMRVTPMVRKVKRGV